MPAIWRFTVKVSVWNRAEEATATVSPLHTSHLSPRQVGHNGRNVLSPTAIGFLVPLFALFIFGPFLCVWFVRTRRTRRIQYAVDNTMKTPLERIKDAMKRLETVTEISDVTNRGKYTCMNTVEEKENADSLSILERDCAICLSTLHAPSPPEPAKLANEDDAATKPSDISGIQPSENENILRLKVCGHEFHAKCLISWFIIRKYSCPICRAMYYGENAEPKLRDVGEVEAENDLRRPENGGAARSEGV